MHPDLPRFLIQGIYLNAYVVSEYHLRYIPQAKYIGRSGQGLAFRKFESRA